MKTLLNIVIAVNVITATLTACMVDSPTMIPAYICAGSVAVAAVTCLIREKLC